MSLQSVVLISVAQPTNNNYQELYSQEKTQSRDPIEVDNQKWVDNR